MNHSTDHRPGTVSSCLQCRSVAYEPGWYASLCTLIVIDEPQDVPAPA